jgi:hypothetical protein
MSRESIGGLGAFLLISATVGAAVCFTLAQLAYDHHYSPRIWLGGAIACCLLSAVALAALVYDVPSASH